MDENVNCDNQIYSDQLDEQIDEKELQFIDDQLEMNDNSNKDQLINDVSNRLIKDKLDKDELINNEQVDLNNKTYANGDESSNSKFLNIDHQLSLDGNESINLIKNNLNENSIDQSTSEQSNIKSSKKEDIIIVHLLAGGKFECKITVSE